MNGASSVELGSPSSDGLAVRLFMKNEGLYRSLLMRGPLGAAESFMDGDWWADDLTNLVRLFIRNQSSLRALESTTARIGRAFAQVAMLARRNTKSGSRKNIAAHYDLGNDFFELMLDPTMTYSAGIFESERSTMEEASIAKIDRLCRELQLRPTDHLLEIGTGWGSTAIHAASNYGCRVTTTTISKEQHAYATARVEAAGLSDRIEVLLEDYRDLEGRYDKIVSVEMIEAVGAEFLDTFFAKVSDLLVPGGRLAIQAITIRDQSYQDALRRADFIKTYVFPGSFIPSTTALLDSTTRASALRLVDLEDITLDYARTLAEWRKNLLPHRDAVVARYSERFWRMWMFYLAYCEATFAERYDGCVQLTFERPQYF